MLVQYTIACMLAILLVDWKGVPLGNLFYIIGGITTLTIADIMISNMRK